MKVCYTYSKIQISKIFSTFNLKEKSLSFLKTNDFLKYNQSGKSTDDRKLQVELYESTKYTLAYTAITVLTMFVVSLLLPLGK